MTLEFNLFKGSKDGNIVPATSRRELGRNEAFVKITHSGVCGTDEHYLHAGVGLGHEGVGVVQEIGTDVKAIKVGDRVGFGWVHKICGRCEPCLTGMDTYCENLHQFGTHDHDVGSFGSHVVWDADALYIIPESLKSEHAAPLMCGGATVWGALSVYNVRPTDRVGVVGVGGLGHLAIQFAAKMGCDVVAFSSTESKRDEAIAFGAKEFYTTKGVTEFKGITKLNHLLVTTSEQPDYKTYLPIMAAGGTLYPLTISFDSPPIPMLPLVVGGLRLQGSAGAPRAQIRKMLQFASEHQIKPMIMTFELNKEGVELGMKTLREGKMRYRGVLVAE